MSTGEAPPPYTEFAPDQKPDAQYNPASYPPPPPNRASTSLSPPALSQRPASVHIDSSSQHYGSEDKRRLSAQLESLGPNQTGGSIYFPPPPSSPSVPIATNVAYVPHASAVSTPLQRPGPPLHVMTEPYVLPQHGQRYNTTLLPDQSQPRMLLNQTYFPPPPPPPSISSAGLAPPSIPPRPASAPPVEYQSPTYHQQFAQAPTLEHHLPVLTHTASQPSPATPILQTPANQQPVTLTHSVSQPTPSTQPLQAQHEDEKHNSFGKRFVGNMLVTRLARSSIQSVASTAQLPMYLSPWGDNNPVTLPNIRKRDIALAGVAHFGVDALADGATEVVGTVTKSVAAWTSEAAADHGIHKMTGSKTPAVTKTGAAISTMEVRIRHKLIGEDAVISYVGQREAQNFVSCAKGWFCPYLYASGRAPRIERKQDFTIARLEGPGLKADATLAPIILSCLERTSVDLITALCDWRDPSPSRPRLGRLAVFFLGISPFRTASAWSQARVPNEARLRLHVPDGGCAIVLPVHPQAPIAAWHSKTLQQIWDEAVNGDRQAIIDAQDVSNFLYLIVDPSGIIDPQMYKGWWHMVRQKLFDMFRAAQALKGASGGLGRLMDPNRTGLVFFRY